MKSLPRSYGNIVYKFILGYVQTIFTHFTLKRCTRREITLANLFFIIHLIETFEDIQKIIMAPFDALCSSNISNLPTS